MSDDNFVEYMDGSLKVASKCRDITIEDWSRHRLPVINKKSFEYL